MTALGKYHPRKVRMDGLTFDSQAEADRYAELQMLTRAGEITELRTRPRHILQPGFTAPDGRKVQPITYEADFSYQENDHLVVEDVKPAWSNRKDGAWRIFRLKAKMMLYVHGIDVQVVERQSHASSSCPCRSRIASRLKAAVHVHISAPDARGKIARGATLRAILTSARHALPARVRRWAASWSARRSGGT